MHRATSARALGRVVAIVLALTPSALLSMPADSASSTTIAANDGVRYDSCRYHPYTYTVQSMAGSADWDADITLYDPEGSRSDSDFRYSGSDPDTGSGSFFICGFEPAGRWRLTIDVTYYDDSYSKIATNTASDTFVLRKPRTTTAYTVSPKKPRPGQVIRVRISSKIERPAGYAPNRYEYVVLESRKGGGAWKRVRGTRTYTSGSGVGVVRTRNTGRRPVQVRAVTIVTSDYAGSVSSGKRIR
jgi:hypothetical protein